jgi:hypothetical protein
MKKKITLLSLLLLLSFKADDLVEIESTLNARTSANFLKTTNNVRFPLEKGTKGSVEESVKLPSGNYGLKLRLENGPHRGDTVWVYHDLNTERIKLTDNNNQLTTNVDSAKNAEALKTIASFVDPLTKTLTKNISDFSKLNLKNQNKSLLTSSSNCKVNQSLSNESDLNNYHESQSIPPFKEIADSTLHSTPCRGTDNNYDVCVNQKNIVEKFSLKNQGGNKIVSKKEYYINREFEFDYEDHARSDMRLMIVDSPDEYTSHATYSVMMFFPRTVLPSVKKVDNVLEVTLPNQEIVKFDPITKEIVGGVMTEGPMIQDERGKAKPAAVKYTGAGVMIRADKSGDFPMGDIEKSDGSKLPSPNTATISKRGEKDCKIPAKDIWYTNYERGGNVFIKKELASDAGLDQFIIKRCGFSIFDK